MNKPLIYAGIGSRKTPSDILTRMSAAGAGLAGLGAVLRSGGAGGADQAFEAGAVQAAGKTEIYLPYKGFRGHQSELFGSTFEARQIAKEFHPNWPGLGNHGREFMARNAYQILGKDLNTPCDFVLCWTPNGKVVGGTGQALRMAAHFKIPVYNMASHELNEINDAIYRHWEASK